MGVSKAFRSVILIPWSQKLGAGPLTSTTTGKTGGLGAEEERAILAYTVEGF